MYSTNTHLQHLLVNGQVLLVPDSVAWQYLHENPLIDDQALSVTDLLWNDYGFTERYDSFSIGFRRTEKLATTWLYCVLLHINGNIQRVHLEKLTCPVCKWSGVCANPKVVDLYIDVPDWQQALKETDKYQPLSCPCCQNKLPRFVIWMEPIA